MCPHIAEGVNWLPQVKKTLIKTLIPFMWPQSLQPHHLLQVLSLDTIMLKIKSQHKNAGGKGRQVAFRS
jgi:hypothetical protein